MNHQGYIKKSISFPGQPKSHEDGYEREKRLHMQLTRYQYKVFIHKGSGGKGGDQHHALSNVAHDSGLIHKTAAGSLFSNF